jgi:hypothetical protein
MELSPGIAPAPKSFAGYFLSAFTKTFGQNELGPDPITLLLISKSELQLGKRSEFLVIDLYEARHHAQYERHLTA